MRVRNLFAGINAPGAVVPTEDPSGGGGSSKTVRLADPRPAFREIHERKTERKNQGERAPTMKTCRHCGEQKDKSEFPVHRDKGNGLSSWCRACHAGACSRWRAKHREKIDAYNARRRAEYAAQREAEHQAARKALNERLREQVRRNRERDEKRRKAAA